MDVLKKSKFVNIHFSLYHPTQLSDFLNIDTQTLGIQKRNKKLSISPCLANTVAQSF